MSNTQPDMQAILECLRDIAHETLDRKRRLGQYAVVWENERIKKIFPNKSDNSSILSEDGSGYSKSP